MATQVDSALSAAGSATSATTTPTADTIAVQAGDVVALATKWEAGTALTINADDGIAAAFTLAGISDHANGDMSLAVHYWTADRTATLNVRSILSGAAPYRDVRVLVIRPAAGKVLQYKGAATVQNTGNSAGATTANVVLTGPGAVLGFVGLYATRGLTSAAFGIPAEFGNAAIQAGYNLVPAGGATVVPAFTFAPSAEWLMWTIAFDEVDPGATSHASGNAQLGDVAANGGAGGGSPSGVSGGAQLGDVTAGGGASVAGVSDASGNANLGDVAAGGGASSQAGTFTSQPLQRNNGTLAANVTLTWLCFRDPTTGITVGTPIAGVTTNAAGIFTVSNVSLIPGTAYLAQWLEAGGQRGWGVAAAT